MAHSYFQKYFNSSFIHKKKKKKFVAPSYKVDYFKFDSSSMSIKFWWNVKIYDLTHCAESLVRNVWKLIQFS